MNIYFNQSGRSFGACISSEIPNLSKFNYFCKYPIKILTFSCISPMVRVIILFISFLII